MPEYVLNRNYSLRSLSGHMIDFIKGQPTYVPPPCVKEAVAIGAEPVETIDKTEAVLGPEEKLAVEPDGEERKQLLFKIFAQLEERNGREDFTAAGMPSIKVIEKIAGFEVDSKERNVLWQEYLENK